MTSDTQWLDTQRSDTQWLDQYTGLTVDKLIRIRQLLSERPPLECYRTWLLGGTAMIALSYAYEETVTRRVAPAPKAKVQSWRDEARNYTPEQWDAIMRKGPTSHQ